MRKIERFDAFMAQMGLNDNQASVDCGLSAGLLTKTRNTDGRDLGRQSIDKILTNYPQLSRSWLLYGTGTMLDESAASMPIRPTQKVKNSENVSSVIPSIFAVLQAQLAEKDKQIASLLSTINRLTGGADQ